MTRQIVRVTAGSRLHFGMLSFGHPHERQFGGAGVMIAAPATRLTISDASCESVGSTAKGNAGRVEQFVEHVSTHAPWWRSPPPFQVSVESVAIGHAGLGSGTQLAMAVAVGLARWCGAPHQTAEALALTVGRGRRSAVGIHGACLGGLIIEGGKLTEGEISPLVSRHPLPEAWRFLLVLPNKGTGISGEAEQQAFAELPPVPGEITAALCRELLCGLAPAAICDDFERFSESLYRYGRLAGECFAARQGGLYASREVEQLVMRCRELGVQGVGQSSWGPTVFALCRDEREAEALAAGLAAAGELRERTALIVAPDNRGIQVEEIEG